MTTVYLSVANIAEWFDKKPATVHKWRARYADFPEPDAMIGDVPGWEPEREAEIRRWESSRPGQGVGGGRRRGE